MKHFRPKISFFQKTVADTNGDWAIKGFIDVGRNIYTISKDTKVISKIVELTLYPDIVRFAQNHALKLILTDQQNFYPDMSFVDQEGHRFAVDLKSTYRVSPTEVNGMTLGAFTGYFRDRQSRKNITFPYESYSGHYILGVIYTRVETTIDERRKYRLDELDSIASVATEFRFFVQEKYRIAADRPGSGNTKNIGSVTNIDRLVNGLGPFAELGLDVFDDYWMFYLTQDMARAVELPKPPYTNLKTYFKYKGIDR